MKYSYLCKVFELIGYMIYGEWYIFIYVRVLKLYLMNIVDHIYIFMKLLLDNSIGLLDEHNTRTKI